MENRSTNERNGSLSDVESDDENEEGDYTVYECPGLAPVRIIFTFCIRVPNGYNYLIQIFTDGRNGSKKSIIFR